MALNPNKLYDVVAINAASLSTQLAACRSAARLAAYASRSSVTAGSASRRRSAREGHFDMVVAGRVTPAGDVAIAMVEAESTDHTWDLVKVRRNRSH